MSDEEKQEHYNRTGAKPKASRKTELMQRDPNRDEEKQTRCGNQGITPYEDDCEALPVQGDTFVNIKRAKGITINQTVLLSNEKRRYLPPNDRQGSLEETVYQRIINTLVEPVYQSIRNLFKQRVQSTLEEEIEHIKDSLRNRMRRKDAHMLSLLWEDKELDYPIEDYFVELQLEEKDLTGSFVKYPDIPLNEIFCSINLARGFKQNILIIGDAGFGKTTLTKKLSYDWAALDPPEYLSCFDMVVNIPLRAIGNRTMEQTVLDYLHSEPSQNINEGIILKQRMNWLIILDGFDEMVSEENKQKVLRFLKQPYYYFSGFSRNSAIVVTSRPYPVNTIRECFDRYISVLGLSTKNQEKYIRNLFKPDSEKADTVISVFQNDEFLKNISRCPLMLHMICCVYGKSSIVSNITTLTLLYSTICNLILSRFAKKEERKILEANEMLIKLGKIALAYEKPFTEDELRKMFPEEEEYNNILRTGFLLSSPTRYDMKTVIYCDFIHRTFAEFFQVIYLVDMITRIEDPDAKASGSESMRLFKCRCRCIDYLTLSDPTMAGFLFGMLGEKILKYKPFLKEIERVSIPLQNLIHIKRESGLNEKSWKIFCDYINKVKYTHQFNLKDTYLLFYGLGCLNFGCKELEIWTDFLDESFLKCVKKTIISVIFQSFIDNKFAVFT